MREGLGLHHIHIGVGAGHWISSKEGSLRSGGSGTILTLPNHQIAARCCVTCCVWFKNWYRTAWTVERCRGATALVNNLKAVATLTPAMAEGAPLPPTQKYIFSGGQFPEVAEEYLPDREFGVLEVCGLENIFLLKT